MRSFRLILPFFPTGTMERVDREGQIVTAKVERTLIKMSVMNVILCYCIAAEPGHHAVPDPAGYKRTSSDHHI